MALLGTVLAVTATFETSSCVTVRAPDSRWFDVRIVADDGRRPWPQWLVAGRVAVLTGPAFLMYRLILSVRYRLRGSTAKAVEVLPWGDGLGPPPDRSRPSYRESFPDHPAARVKANEVSLAIGRGEFPTATSTQRSSHRW
jgi:hypothetical protein